MFTGIVTHRGTVLGVEDRGEDLRLEIEAGNGFLEGCKEGDSIACSGACLTAVDIGENRFFADVSVETLRCTTIAQWGAGQRVNLERSMRADGRFDGHMVSGHVDGMAELVSSKALASSLDLEFEVEGDLAGYIAAKGSVCLDGVSLTVNAVDDCRFSVCIIPHTQVMTGLAQLSPGDRVNIEVDLVARYLQRLLQQSGVVSG